MKVNFGKIVSAAKKVRQGLTWLTNMKDILPLPGWLKKGLQKGRDAGAWQEGPGPGNFGGPHQ